jgi:hypothetical protein
MERVRFQIPFENKIKKAAVKIIAPKLTDPLRQKSVRPILNLLSHFDFGSVWFTPKADFFNSLTFSI